MRKQFLCSAAAIAIATAVSGPVAAADMPIKAAPIRPAIYDWTGFYIGAHVGYGSARFDFATGFDQGNKGGWAGGLQLGYNWQRENVVWGIEGDVSFADFHDGQTSPAYGKVDLLSSLRGRLGMTFDRVLVYGTGGVAYVHGKADVSTLGTVVSPTFGNFRGVAGAGAEWAYSRNWTFRVEALDYLGSTTFDAGGDLGNKIGNIWVARFGANYRF